MENKLSLLLKNGVVMRGISLKVKLKNTRHTFLRKCRKSIHKICYA